jgi:hypothetical protein
MTSVPTALFAPTTHASFFSGGRCVAVLDHWESPLRGGLGRWRRGCAARRCRPPLPLLPPPPIPLSALLPLSLVGCGGVGVGWRRAAAAGAGVPCGVRVCRGRALPTLSWVGAASATSPAAPSASSRGSPGCKLLPVFSLCSCMCECGGWWAVGFAVRVVRGVPRVRQRCYPPPNSTPCPSAPLMASSVGLSWSPSPTSLLSLGRDAKLALHAACPAATLPLPQTQTSGTHTHPPPPTDVGAAVGRGCGCCWLRAASMAASMAAGMAAGMSASTAKHTRQAATVSAAAWNDGDWAPAPR